MDLDRSLRFALKVSVAFWLASVSWLLLSDIVLEVVFDLSFDGWGDLAKGVCFMTVLGLALFAYLLHHQRDETTLRRQLAHQTELDAQLFQLSPVAMWVYDPTSLEILQVNDTMVALSERSREQLVGLPVPELSLPRDRESVARLIRDLDAHGAPYTWLHVDSQGANRWIEVNSNVIVQDGDEVRLALGRDVTAQRDAEEALKASERRLAGVLTSMQEVAFSLDLEAQRIVYLNDVAAELMGLPADQLSMPLDQFTAMVVPADRPALQRALDEVVRRGWAESELRVVLPDRRERTLGLRGTAVLDESGTVSQIDGVVIDLTRRHELEELVAHQRSFDQLTGLPIRTAFLAAVDASLAGGATPSPPAVVAMFDLDRFADVNESAGHLAGDRLLVAVAQRMGAVLDPGMVAARVGGDEFALFCPGGLSSSSDIGTRLRHAVEGPFLVDHYEFFVSMSVGLAEAERGSTAEDLIRDAHLAMSAAKERTSGIELFEPQHRSLALDRVRVDNDLRRAMAEDRLVAVYQPEIDLLTGRLLAVEALVRWDDPVRGLVPAGEFVSEAERSNLIVDLGDVMLARALQQAGEWWRRYGETAPIVWVNLSRRELDDPDSADRVLSAVERYAVPIHKIGIEITETAFVAEGAGGLRSLTRLAEAGIALALDDFGTGWSSLKSLKSFPLTAVKIDQSFVQNVATEVRDRQIVTAIVGMAHGLSLATLAEGVETRAQLDTLIALGCDMAQGYLLGRPGTAAEVERVLDDGGVPTVWWGDEVDATGLAPAEVDAGRQ